MNYLHSIGVEADEVIRAEEVRSEEDAPVVAAVPAVADTEPLFTNDSSGELEPTWKVTADDVDGDVLATSLHNDNNVT